jgi:uncharacterized protein YdiU (UPF0061 family)
VFSSIDRGARYTYGRQAEIGLWNLSRFAESLLIRQPVDVEPDLAPHPPRERLPEGRRVLVEHLGHSLHAGVGTFVERTFGLLQENRQDFTAFFRALAFGAAESLFDDAAAFRAWDLERRAHGRQQPLVRSEIPRLRAIQRVLQVVVARDVDRVHRGHEHGPWCAPVHDLLRNLTLPLSRRVDTQLRNSPR